MPTYQYRCNDCNHEFETEQRITADPLKECPECKKETLRRVIGSIGIAFKGSGFHINDYSNKKKPPPPKSTISCTKDSCPKKEKNNL